MVAEADIAQTPTQPRKAVPMAKRLSGETRTRALEALQGRGWTMVEGRDAVHKTFQFKNFNEAFGVMSRVALYAETVNHHPEWFNVWRTLEITLSTHEAGGLSELDVAMAEFIDELTG